VAKVELNLGILKLSEEIKLTDADNEELSRLMLKLADYRVLYEPYEAELPDHCESAVERLRQELGDRAQRLDVKSGLGLFLVALQRPCREFLTRLQAAHRTWSPENRHGMGYDIVFYQALGEFRGRFGLYLQALLAQNPVPIPDELVPLVAPPVADFEGGRSELPE